MQAKPRRLTLRTSLPDDASYAAALEEANRQWVGAWSVERHTQLLADPNHQHLTIYDEADARVGFVILYHQESNRLVELVRIVSEQKGQGIGTATLKIVQDMAFNQLNAHRLQFDVFEHNEAALRVYKSAGFRIEGVLRDPYFREGRFISIVIMSMLEDEFQRLQD